MEEFIAALRDPQGFIDARGGLEAFYRPDDGAAGTPGVLGPGQARTPYPQGGLPMATPGTGMPRAPSGITGAPGSLAPAGDDLPVAPARSKLPLLVGGGVLALALVGGGIFMATRGKDAPPSPPVAAKDTTPEAPPVDKPADKPVDKPADPVEKPVEPPPPAIIHIAVATTPPGADVFVGAEAASRGKTPLTIELPKGQGETTIVVRAEGFKEASRPVKLGMDAQLEIALAKDRSGGKRPPGDGKKPPGDTKKPPGDKKPGSDDVLAPSF
jgi:hypothetical protein